MRVLAALLAAAALMVGGGARADGPPAPPSVARPVLAKGDPAPAAGLLSPVEWARYDVERLRWLTAERDACIRQVEGGPPPGGWRPTLVVAGVSISVGLAGGLYLGARFWRR